MAKLGEFHGTITKTDLSKASALKKEVSRLASMANKRIARLEKNNLQNTPAYQKWIASGGQKFSVKGKSYNELQKELARIREFANAKTSTIKGVKTVYKAIAENTGLEWNSIQELVAKSSTFFAITRKVDEYLRITEHTANAIGSDNIIQAVSNYVRENSVDLADLNVDVESIVGKIAELTSYEKASEIFAEFEGLNDFVVIG